MPARIPLLFYDECSRQPADCLELLPGLHRVGNLSKFEEALEASHLIFLGVTGKLRQEAIRLMIKQRKSFALLGLDARDLEDSARMQTAARKKHLQICWLGSLRFRQVAARMKELLSGGSLGEIENCQYWESSNSRWQPYQIQDLLYWLLPDPETPIVKQPESNDADLSLQIHATGGNATIHLHKDHMDSFLVTRPGYQEKMIQCPNQAATAELGLLLLLDHLNLPWKMLAKPWECNR